MPKYRLDKFSGLTDVTTGASPDKLHEANNIFITEDNKITRRMGLFKFNFNAAQLPTSSRVVSIFSLEFDTSGENVFAVTQNGRMYVSTSAGWDEVYGVGGYSFHLAGGVQWVKASKYRDIALIHSNVKAPLVLYRNDSGTWLLVAAGLDTRTVGQQIVQTGGSLGPFSWTYFYSYQFTTDFGVTYKIVSPAFSFRDDRTTLTGKLADFGPYSAYTDDPNSPRHLPRDVPNQRCRIEVYRTDSAGATHKLQYKEFVTSSVSYINSSTTEVAASLQEILYIDTGETEDGYIYEGSQNPNECRKATVTSDGVGWALAVEGQLLKQSKPGAIYAWPFEYNLGLNEYPTAINSIGIYPIVFTRTGIQRIEGFLDAQGNGVQRAKEISSSVGCSFHEAIVKVDNKLFFPALDGFYVTDGFQTQKISMDLTHSYDEFIRSATYVHGAFDSVNKRIIWTAFNGATFVYHMKPKIPGFTKISYSGATLSCVGFSKKLTPAVVWGTSEGTVVQLQETSDLNKYDNDAFTKQTYDYIGTQLNEPRSIEYAAEIAPNSLGLLDKRKWTTKTYLAFHKLTQNISASLQTRNDLKTLKNMPALKHIASVLGDIKIFKRNLPASTLRSTYKQFRISTPNNIIYSSSSLGPGDLNGTTDTFLLTDTITFGEFPLDDKSRPVAFKFHYVSGGVEQTPLDIVSVSADTLVLDDPTNTIVDGTVDSWSIKGAPRDEMLKLDAIEVEFQPIGEGYKDVKDDGQA